MATPKDKPPTAERIFNPVAAKKPVEDWVTSMDVKELTWAWEVTRDCMDIIAHHSTPWGHTRGSQKAILWQEWFGSFLFHRDANHCVHGLVKELKGACPESIAHGLLRVVEEGFRAGTGDIPKTEREAITTHLREQGFPGLAESIEEAVHYTLTPEPRITVAPTPKPSPFTLIVGGRED
jgi:hypothetical protein